MGQAKCRILCVDDHEDSSAMLKILLTDSDYEVHVANTFAEALNLAVSRQFDLYVLDKRLPDGSGMELCRRLNELTPNVPCIFYTGDTYELNRREAMAAGVDVYVQKPDIEALIKAVERLLVERDCGVT